MTLWHFNKPWHASQNLDDEEQSIADFIRINIISNHYHFTDGNFIFIPNQAYTEKSKNIENPKKFSISHNFINNFKERNRISTRKVHFKRKENVEDKTYYSFNSDINKLLKEADKRDDIVLEKAVETSWHILPTNVHDWANTGDENVIILTKYCEKANFTAMCSVTSNYQPLNLFLIVDKRSTTEEDLENIKNEIYPHTIRRSNSQWMTK